MEAMNEEDEREPNARARPRPLGDGETPPYDLDAT